MDAKQNAYEHLSKIDLSHKIKTKQNMKYISWSTAWSEVKKFDPNASFRIYPQEMDNCGNTRFWHDDGRSGWVEVGVTICGQEHIEVLAIMDMRNKAIAADAITSVEANKSYKRCMVKAIALHGLASHIFEGEDLPEETVKVLDLHEEIKGLLNKKCGLSAKAKERCAELCREAERKANPEMDEESITGNYMNIADSEILEVLKKNLMAVRK